MMRVSRAPTTVSFGDWLALHVTGPFLVVALFAHLWAVHYAAGEEGRSFDAVCRKLRSPLYAFLDLGLLALALYHGLVGLRRFVVDLEILSPRGTRVFSGVLAALGALGFYWGWVIYRVFVVDDHQPTRLT